MVELLSTSPGPQMTAPAIKTCCHKSRGPGVNCLLLSTLGAEQRVTTATANNSSNNNYYTWSSSSAAATTLSVGHPKSPKHALARAAMCASLCLHTTKTLWIPALAILCFFLACLLLPMSPSLLKEPLF